MKTPGPHRRPVGQPTDFNRPFLADPLRTADAPRPQRVCRGQREHTFNSISEACAPRTGPVRAPDKRRGSAVLVILALLAAMSAIVIANTRTLHTLKQELQLLDQRQNQRLHAVPGQ